VSTMAFFDAQALKNSTIPVATIIIFSFFMFVILLSFCIFMKSFVFWNEPL
jgi:hypothetical protein